MMVAANKVVPAPSPATHAAVDGGPSSASVTSTSHRLPPIAGAAPYNQPDVGHEPVRSSTDPLLPPAKAFAVSVNVEPERRAPSTPTLKHARPEGRAANPPAPDKQARFDIVSSSSDRAAFSTPPATAGGKEEPGFKLLSPPLSSHKRPYDRSTIAEPLAPKDASAALLAAAEAGDIDTIRAYLNTLGLEAVLQIRDSQTWPLMSIAGGPGQPLRGIISAMCSPV